MTIHDEDLYQRIQSNDKDALRTLYNKYEKALYTFAYKMTSDPSLSEEVVQDVFLKVWQKKNAYQSDRGKFSTWLFALTRYSVIDGLRKMKLPQQALDDQTVTQEGANYPHSPIEIEVFKNETADYITHAIEHLNTDQQSIIHLFYFKTFSQSQIASELNIPLGTVKSRLRLAVHHLKKHLDLNMEGGSHNEYK